MFWDGCRRVVLGAVSVAALIGLAVPQRAAAQAGSQGSVVVTVNDQSGGVVPTASLALVALRTNDTRVAATSGGGSYTFVNLPIGTYKLTITKAGYDTAVYDSVLVQASQTTSITAALKVGQTSQTVTVSTATTPVLETSSNAIGIVVDMKQIEDLPLAGRDLTSLAYLVAGYNGTFNGLPSSDQGSNIDGVIGNSSRMKFTGNIQAAVSPRLEDIEQMTVQTDQLDLNSGFGQASTQVNFVSRRGGNEFHGRVFDNFSNSGLDANTWYNNAVPRTDPNVPGIRKTKLILNDFGGTLGGPILRNKLFFFGAFAMSKQPSSFTSGNTLLSAAAQAGNFEYLDANGNPQSLNVLSLAAASGLPSAINSTVGTQLQAINSAVSHGTVSANPADLNLETLNWNVGSPTTFYYPAGRVDLNLSEKARMYVSFLMTEELQPTAVSPIFPGPGFSDTGAGNKSKNYTSSYGFDYTFSPQLLNQFKAGFLYDAAFYSTGAKPLYATSPTISWALGSSGQNYTLPVSTYYPILTASDSMTWERGAHTVQFGFSWYREQDHYWNPPAGFDNYALGVASGDPVNNAISTTTLPNLTPAQVGEAQALYATLTGRIYSVSGESPYSIKNKSYSKPGEIGEYPLDELSNAVGLFAEDSFKATPSLTLNYGLRWDLTGAQHDLTGFYHSAAIPAIYGPTAVGDLFHPGSLGGDLNPMITSNSRPYNPWKVTPQPSVGFVWNPKNIGGPLERLLGDGDTVIRGGYALRRFTEPYQYFWNTATDFGSFYYQYFTLNANNTGATGTFAPGSLSLGDALPAFNLSPSGYQASAPESEFTFQGSTPVVGMDPNIKQPYSESWNFGIQRSIGHSRALEIRYNGNRAGHQWIFINPNEVNVFENGFLAEFKRAQQNLAVGILANPLNPSFSSSNGQPTPILDAAFGGPGAADYTNGQFIGYLKTGQVGALANYLAGVAGTVPYLCNLVGSGFSPCAAIGAGGGAGYPINFFQANPYASTTYGNGQNGTGLLTAAGYSNYNALQVDMRQGSWHGLQYDANYTWSHSLGVNSPNSWTGSFNAFTLRNLRKSYGPTLFDLQNVAHVSATYDLPFGRGRQFATGNGFVDKSIGGWTLGTIVTAQTGGASQFGGGNLTYNDYGDGGINLTGVTTHQLQKAVGLYRLPGQTDVATINPKYIKNSTQGGANPAYITANTTPGTLGLNPYLHGPHQFLQDVAITKAVSVRESMRFTLQGEFLNAWNHPTFGGLNTSVQSSGFGLGGVTNSPRVLQIRGNFEF